MKATMNNAVAERTPQKWPTLFSENKKPRFWDMPPKWAPPEISKSFFPKTRYPVFGTCFKNGRQNGPKWPPNVPKCMHGHIFVKMVLQNARP
jgi:hypothetical protein